MANAASLEMKTFKSKGKTSRDTVWSIGKESSGFLVDVFNASGLKPGSRKNEGGALSAPLKDSSTYIQEAPVPRLIQQ